MQYPSIYRPKQAVVIVLFWERGATCIRGLPTPCHFECYLLPDPCTLVSLLRELGCQRGWNGREGLNKPQFSSLGWLPGFL